MDRRESHNAREGKAGQTDSNKDNRSNNGVWSDNVGIKYVYLIIILVVFIVGASALTIQRNNFVGRNCVDASSECQDFFDKIGITSRMIYGSPLDKNQECGHCWLEVDMPFRTWELECTSLRFKDVSSEYKIDWREE